jgi:hypothetical protein
MDTILIMRLALLVFVVFILWQMFDYGRNS